MTGPLHGRSALVTGATGGIGRAIAEALASAGAVVVVTGRNVSRGEAVVKAIESDGGVAHFVPADLSLGAGALRKVVDDALAHTGRIDILVNNAAVLIDPTPTAEITYTQMTAALNLNVGAAFVLTGMLAPSMVARGRGVVINMGSINGILGKSGVALYGATKAALHCATQCWAAEFGPGGVRVNAIAPGPVLTEGIQRKMDRLEPMLALVPSRRASTPAEIGAVAVFLASDAAANIHGAILSVDGGRASVCV